MADGGGPATRTWATQPVKAAADTARTAPRIVEPMYCNPGESFDIVLSICYEI
jgi:hypothetical protein